MIPPPEPKPLQSAKKKNVIEAVALMAAKGSLPRYSPTITASARL